MDYGSKFSLLIASRRFSSFEEFQSSLDWLSDSFGYRFTNSKFSYYDKDTPQRETFVYKYLDLKCVRQRKHACPAFCKVRCRKNYIYIRDWQIEHNHPPDPPDNSTVVDFTETFNTIFTSLTFDTFENFEEKVKELEKVTGTRFTKYSSRLLPNGHPLKEALVYERVNYSCIHSGTTKRKNEAPLVNARSQKIGCPSRIRACVGSDKMKIMLCNMRHNHIVSNIYPGLSRAFPNKALKQTTYNSIKEGDQEDIKKEDKDVDYAIQLPEGLLMATDLPFLPIVFKKTVAEENANQLRLKKLEEVNEDTNEPDCDAYSDASTFGMYDETYTPPTYSSSHSDFLRDQSIFKDQAFLDHIESGRCYPDVHLRRTSSHRHRKRLRSTLIYSNGHTHATHHF